MSEKTFKYFSFGIAIDSDIELPGFDLYSGNCDVTIRKGKVPDDISDAVIKRKIFHAKPGMLLLKIPDVVNVLIINGEEVIYQTNSESDLDTVRLYMLGSVLGTILMQRGFLPIHASGVKINSKVILFSGDSGAGKSTMAAGFASKGFQIITDDIASLSLLNNNFQIYSGGSQLKLWDDAIYNLNFSKQNLKKVRNADEKFYFPVENRSADLKLTLPVQKIYILRNQNNTEPVLRQITGIEKFIILKENTYRQAFVNGLGLEAEHFGLISKLANSCDVAEITRDTTRCKVTNIISLVMNDLDNI